MYRSILMAVLVVVAFGLVAFGAVRGDEPAAKNVTNAACPLMRQAADSHFRVEWNGQYVYFCCEGCIEIFNSNPEAAVAKLSETDRAAVQKNTTCPISGEKIESFTVRSEYQGKLVYFCCAGCKQEWDEKHAK